MLFVDCGAEKKESLPDYTTGSTPHSSEVDMFTRLHFFTLDTITKFLYRDAGWTACMAGNYAHRSLLKDMLNPGRRRLAWFAINLPRLTDWLYSQSGLLRRLIDSAGVLPMKTQATYTGIRQHALRAFCEAKERFKSGDNGSSTSSRCLVDHMLNLQATSANGLSDLDIAAECADDLLAGVETTANTLVFLVWVLSQPENACHQWRLHDELRNANHNSEGNIPVKTALSLPFLDAVLKETLRLYSPIFSSEPRISTLTALVDDHVIPPGTIVSSAPFVQHRFEGAFPDPLVWDPDRWLGGKRDSGVGQRWFWAFSSGARMCIGVHLAFAEMARLVAALYGTYKTSLSTEAKVSPASSTRTEMMYDELKAAEGGIGDLRCSTTMTRRIADGSSRT